MGILSVLRSAAAGQPFAMWTPKNFYLTAEGGWFDRIPRTFGLFQYLSNSKVKQGTLDATPAAVEEKCEKYRLEKHSVFDNLRKCKTGRESRTNGSTASHSFLVREAISSLVSLIWFRYILFGPKLTCKK